MNEKKSVVKSKTLWINALFAVIAVKVPEVREWMTQHPDELLAVCTVGNMLLRLVTGGLKVW